MTDEEFENGLKQRGFQNIESFCDKGKCHKNQEHFILVTDGLVIYSSVPRYDDVESRRGDVIEFWDFQNDEYARRPFKFSDLDIIIGRVNLVNEIENHK